MRCPFDQARWALERFKQREDGIAVERIGQECHAAGLCRALSNGVRILGTLLVLDMSLPGGLVDGSGSFELRANDGGERCRCALTTELENAAIAHAGSG